MNNYINQLPELNDNRLKAAILVSVLILGAGALFASNTGNSSTPASETQLVAAWPDYGPNLVMWPIENNRVSLEGANVEPRKVSEGQQMKLLLSGKVDIATTDIAGIKRLYEQGEMEDYTVIGGYYIEKSVNGSSISTVYTQRSSDITEPEDLRGKTLALGEPGSTSNLLFKEVMSEKYGVEPTEYEVVHKPQGAEVLLEQGDVDGALVWSQFVVNEEFNEDNRKLVDFGTDFKELHGSMPSNGVVVAEKSAVEENPEKYRKSMQLFKKAHDWSRANLETVASEWSEKGYLDLQKEEWLEVKKYNAHWHPLDEERIAANTKVWDLMEKYDDSENTGEMPEFGDVYTDLGYIQK